MSTLQTTQSTTNQTRESRPITPILRTSGAQDAPRFAQVLQGFEQEEQSPVVESGRESENAQGEREGPEVASDPATDSGASEQPSGEGKSESETSANRGTESQTEDPVSKDAESTNGAAKGSAGSDDSNQTQAQERQSENQAGADQQNAPDAVQQTRTADFTRLDPLQNKSDQAKLSIRGFIRAARAQAAPDLTTLAVQTRLGDAEPIRPQDPSRPIDPKPANDGVKPDGVRPEPRPLNNPTRNPLDSISDTPPDSTKGKGGDTGLRADQNQQQPAQEVSRTKIDPSRVDAQAQRSTRSEVATFPASARESVQPSRADVLQSLIRSGTNARAEGAISSRAVTGVEASGSSRSGIETSVTRGEQAPKPTSSEQSALQAKTIAQVQRGLASLMRSSDSEMTLRLTPERLGELRIQIKRDGDRLTLRLSTQNSEASELLKAGSEELTRALQSKGIQIERVHIEHQPAGENQQGGFDLGQGSQGGHTPEQDHGDQQEQGAPGESFADDPGTPDQHGIWTELGLDAIA